jgi:predicted nucleotidyltransferase
MPLPGIIENNKASITELCKKHGVTELYVFGSAVRDDFTSDSDVDFALEYDYRNSISDPLANMLSLKCQLESLLKREVDLIEYSQVTNKYLKYFIDQEKLVLYA